MAGEAVAAAGAVVTRKGREVLLVHRPKYDDWSFPKGKQDPGEHLTVTAVREVQEETGLHVRLCRPLLPQVYAVAGGKMKTVRYWAGQAVGDDDVSGYRVNKEIDDLQWVELDKARRMLTYVDDIELLDDYDRHPRRTSTTIIVRHGRAMKRRSWRKKDDRKRPLTRVGRAQAKAIVAVLDAYAPTRVITSTSTRCAATLKPFATGHDLAVEQLPGLSEEKFSAKSLRRIARDVLSNDEPTVICSHRPVLPGLLAAFGDEEEPLEPGEMVVLHHRRGTLIASERHKVR